jgi:hypothetical protein
VKIKSGLLPKPISRVNNQARGSILLENGSKKDVLTDIETRRDPNKVTVIKVDDFNQLVGFKQILTLRHGEAAVTVISSKEEETSVHNAHYQCLMKTNRVGAGVKFVLCTKLLQAGVNCDVPAEIFYIHPQATDGLLQMLVRPRIDRKNEINLTVKVFVR